MPDINWNPTRRELRQFAGLVVPAFIGLFGVILGWQTGSWALPRTMWTVALVIAVIGVAFPPAVKPLFVGLTVAAYPIGYVVSNVVVAASVLSGVRADRLAAAILRPQSDRARVRPRRAVVLVAARAGREILALFPAILRHERTAP